VKKIQIVSPAKSIDAEKIEFAKSWFADASFEVTVGENAAGEFNYFSGTDEERLSDFQKALDEDHEGIIICSRGGYGSVRIVDRISWSQFVRYPKLVCGYSDVTVFHNRMNRMGYPSLHCTAPLNFEENTPEALTSLNTALLGGTNSYDFEGSELNRVGEADAKVVGGNLAILSTLCGTDDDLDTHGKILFIEDVGEAVYAIDRMMWQLEKSGKLKDLKGLMVGGMTEMKDSAVPFGKTVEEVIAESVAEYDFPLCFNFPAGHIKDNRAIIFGKKARLEVSENGAIFTQVSEGF
jgi:muramoyltetrapeptide carboxypeptidase